MKYLLMAASAAALMTASGCSPAEDTETSQAASAPETTDMAENSPTFGTFGVDTQYIDENTAPGDDFNRYVNGKWLDTFEIPADKTRYGAFDMLAEQSEKQVHEIIEETAEASPAPETLEGKIAAYYNAYMDTETIQAMGLEPVQPYLDKIDLSASGDLLFNPVSVGPWEGVTLLFGLIVTVQGFEISRYLGNQYSPATRISSMRFAQLLSAAIYIAYILLMAYVFRPEDIPLDEAGIIDMMQLVAPVLPGLLVAAALAAQFSAAIDP